MSGGNLAPLQVRVLEVLSVVEPRWTLTGGGALILALGHRTTRYLDLVWSSRTGIAEVSRVVRDVLGGTGFDVAVVQSGNTFERLTVSVDRESVILDLVAEPAEPLEPALHLSVGAVTILVDSRHAILVNKLCALLGRVELRDLVDVRELLAAGGDLDRALDDAPLRDGGFSALTLAWVLESFAARALAIALGSDEQDAAALDDFRKALIARLVQSSAPD